MARRVEGREALDDYPTQPWATRALCDLVLPGGIAGQTVLEPCANRGFMVRPLGEYFGQVTGRDVFDYGCGFAVDDFLMPPRAGETFDWIVANPPFRLGLDFTLAALERARVGVAMFVRAGFLEGGKRYRALYGPRPPTVVCHFAERVPLVRGRCDGAASTATAYVWIVWIKGAAPRPPVWIPPGTRARLERAGDYAHPGGSDWPGDEITTIPGLVGDPGSAAQR